MNKLGDCQFSADGIDCNKCNRSLSLLDIYDGTDASTTYKGCFNPINQCSKYVYNSSK